MKSSAPASRAAASNRGIGRAGRASRMLSATLPWNRYGSCGTQATPARQAPGSIRARSVSPTRIRPESGSMNRSNRLAMVDLPAPLTPTSAVRRPAGISRSRARTAGSIRPGYVYETSRKADRQAGRPAIPVAGRDAEAHAGHDPAAVARRERLVEDGERARGDGTTRGARVVAGGELAQRQEELGHDDEHRQRAVEGDRAVHQAQADLDRDERDRDGAAPLEHERGLERGPQDLHRRVAVLAADRPDRVDLLAAASEHLERGEAAQHVEEERAEPADLGKAPLGDRARPSTDVRQQQDEDRPGEEQDERGRRVDDEGRDHDQERDRDARAPWRAGTT